MDIVSYPDSHTLASSTRILIGDPPDSSNKYITMYHDQGYHDRILPTFVDASRNFRGSSVVEDPF